jgi:hypothetical protein
VRLSDWSVCTADLLDSAEWVRAPIPGLLFETFETTPGGNHQPSSCLPNFRTRGLPSQSPKCRGRSEISCCAMHRRKLPCWVRFLNPLNGKDLMIPKRTIEVGIRRAYSHSTLGPCIDLFRRTFHSDIVAKPFRGPVRPLRTRACLTEWGSKESQRRWIL